MSETPEPEPTEDQTYFVLFAANVNASDPGEAVRLLVDRMVDIGLRKWSYRVDTVDDTRQLIGYYDGHGNPLPLPMLDAPLPEVDDADSSAPSPTLDTDSGDAELSAYAENLSQS